jgi:hypothetical protein
MRLGLIGVVVGVLVLPACDSEADPPHGRYSYVDACQLYRENTVADLSAGLPEMAQPATGGPNNLPYDLSICPLQFGSTDGVTMPSGDRWPSSTASSPAFRAATITAYRYNAREGQTAAQRARILIGTLASTNDKVTPPHGNLNAAFLQTRNEDVRSIAEVWALAENVVLDIVYATANTDGIPPAAAGDDGQNQVLALTTNAAELLPCVTQNDDRPKC